MNPDTLPDLVNTRLGDTENTEGEIDAIDALLTLGDTRENLIDEDDNAALMPIGALTGKVNVDNAIANIIDTEENKKEAQKPTDPGGDQIDLNNPTTPEETDPTSGNVPDPNPRLNSASTTQGSLQIKTHAQKEDGQKSQV